ncbi:hypothetical protein C1X27_24880 [Pseudomonas sp. MPR-AND1B]|nr:hypothetical protein C1X26_22445 [Pseudomonas sp. MPR-R3A]PMY99003.1 hypothetical protein C1X24_08015 [Pseudomonas sp. FW305-124]PMZ71143.1 hypothetical protein C1X25_15130 [Pseudomonas sp. GW247-3R2A]PNA91288.1 hypothetical protein C1X23_18750 [Pseudomonas sp. FW300-E2]PNA97220.1 hypothetical protein C1X27_24880 [Pseudomonas sp. MPR-AND1B]PRW66765.1 hypothetical protein C7A09_20915 [Pseudomonas fluorescens]RZI26961.1 hypothetical protein EUX58_05345 [Pseudomonas sp. 770NI]
MPAIAICQPAYDRSHAPRGNAMHPLTLRVTCCPAGRGASQAAFPRRAWERSRAHRYRRQASSHTGFCAFKSVAQYSRQSSCPY